MADRKLLGALLKEHFSKEEIENLAFELGLDDESLGDTKGKMIRELIRTCETRTLINDLVTDMVAKRPEINFPAAHSRSNRTPYNLLTHDYPRKNEDDSHDLGYGIALTGKKGSQDLTVFFSAWESIDDNGIATTGWLYTHAQKSLSDAVFKLQLYESGRGIIHLCSFASPEQTITLTNHKGQKWTWTVFVYGTKFPEQSKYPQYVLNRFDWK